MPDTFTFEDKSKRTIRVVFEPDGTPLYCGADLAIIAGYKSAKGAMNRDRLNVETVMRWVWWTNSEKRGCTKMHCFTAENAKLFLQKKPRQTDAVKWFLNTVIPEAEAIGRRRAEEQAEMVNPPEGMEIAGPPQGVPTQGKEIVGIADRLDAIILECALLKRELLQTR